MLPLRWWYGIVLNLTLAVLVVSGAALFTIRSGKWNSSPPCLEIKDAYSGELCGRWPLKEDGEFAVEFIHSVNKDPVRETFAVQGRRIRPVSARFSSFGAGMQSGLGEGQKLSRDGDSLVISGFSMVFEELDYIVGTVSDHTLYINGETVSLRELCGKNARIKMRIVN